MSELEDMAKSHDEHLRVKRFENNACYISMANIYLQYAPAFYDIGRNMMDYFN